MESPPVRTRLLAMLALVVPVAFVATVIATAIGRLDTALFFVGVPCLLALVIGLLPGETTSAMLFQVITIVLLLISAFLHEGALCVLLVSPLVYGVAFAALGITKLVERRSQRYGVGLLFALVALEGLTPGLRISPEHEVAADRVVAEQCVDFERALDRGPRIDPEADRGWLLRLAQYPTPTSATGTGLQPGDTWELGMPAGSVSTEVVSRTPGRIEFGVTADGARTTRWVTLQRGVLTWEQTAEGCRAEVRIDFVRDLDPAFWFGPLSEVFMTAGADAFLAGLD